MVCLVLINEDNEDKFTATLNRDCELIKLKNGLWDINFDKGDHVIVKGEKSLFNACIIALLTAYNELKNNPTYYEKFNKAYWVLKENKTDMTMYKIHEYFKEVLEDIRRIKSIDRLEVTDSETNNYAYDVFFRITSHNDETVQGSVAIG